MASIEEALTAILDMENNYSVYMLRGKCFDKLKEHAKAKEQFESALNICPEE